MAIIKGGVQLVEVKSYACASQCGEHFHPPSRRAEMQRAKAAIDAAGETLVRIGREARERRKRGEG